MKNALIIIAIVAMIIFFASFVVYNVIKDLDDANEKVVKTFGWLAVGSLSFAMLCDIVALFF